MQSAPEGAAPTRLADEAYDAIKRMIRDRELRPGSKITEAVLTRKLGMSRTPVRDALTRVAAEGFLEPYAGRGYIVQAIKEQDLDNVYRVRAELDALAAEEACQRARRVDIARLEDLMDDIAGARAGGRDNDVTTLNNDFHAMLGEISGNAFLKETLDGIRSVFDRNRPIAYTRGTIADGAYSDRMFKEHSGILDAIRGRDAELARRLAKEHVEYVLAIRKAQLAQDLGMDGGTAGPRG
ncbi:MAG TPA: GntR family transcriptional regulator [Trebonia sp.]|jgi:DNA-binding GntR family transcriptional regulator